MGLRGGDGRWTPPDKAESCDGAAGGAGKVTLRDRGAAAASEAVGAEHGGSWSVDALNSDDEKAGRVGKRRPGMLAEEAAVVLVTRQAEVDEESSAGKSDSVAAEDKLVSKRPKSGPKPCNTQSKERLCYISV